MYLLQEVLGDPQEDFEISDATEFEFSGLNFDTKYNLALMFEPEISVTAPDDKEVCGIFETAKYRNKDFIQLLYIVDEKYPTVFNLYWNGTKYETTNGYELFYGIPFIVSSTDFWVEDELLVWRNDMIAAEEKEEPKEIINTTYFSAILNCQFYEFNKENKEKKLLPICNQPDDCRYHHLSTYHMEDEKIPLNQFSPSPFLEPTYRPRKKILHKWGDRDDKQR